MRELHKFKTQQMRRSAAIFSSADENNDGCLDFPEFVTMVARLQAGGGRQFEPWMREAWLREYDGELREWFDAVDIDHSGSISMTEWFAFSLREARHQGLARQPAHAMHTFPLCSSHR